LRLTVAERTDMPARTVACPACGGPSVYASSNRWRPFCSERCRQLDLGAWASERFKIAADADPAPGDQVAPKPLSH